MFAPLHTLTAALGLFVLCVRGSPVSRRDVIAPKITSPNASSVWPVGSTQTVTWDTSDFPPVSQITNILGQVILGQDANNSLNLDFDHPLAKNFNLTDGSVNITVPAVIPGDNYLIVLFGDSGDSSPDFSITNITIPASPTAPASASSTSSETLITTPIPITGSTITGGDSPSTTADSESTTSAVDSDSVTITSTSTDTTTAPLTTSTTPASTNTASPDTTTSASSTNPTSAAWSIHYTSSMNLKTLSLFVCAGITLVLV